MVSKHSPFAPCANLITTHPFWMVDIAQGLSWAEFIAAIIGYLRFRNLPLTSQRRRRSSHRRARSIAAAPISSRIQEANEGEPSPATVISCASSIPPISRFYQTCAIFQAPDRNPLEIQTLSLHRQRRCAGMKYLFLHLAWCLTSHPSPTHR